MKRMAVYDSPKTLFLKRNKVMIETMLYLGGFLIIAMIFVKALLH